MNIFVTLVMHDFSIAKSKGFPAPYFCAPKVVIGYMQYCIQTGTQIFFSSGVHVADSVMGKYYRNVNGTWQNNQIKR